MNKGGAGGVSGGGGLGSGGGGGGSGPTAAAAASATQKQKMLLQRVETDISNIVDNFSHLVNVSRVIFPFFFLIDIPCGYIFPTITFFSSSFYTMILCC
jgi:hypothetical protein